MTSASHTLQKWAERRGWDDTSQKALLLSFIDELGPEAVGLLDCHLAEHAGQGDENSLSVGATVQTHDDLMEASFDASAWLARADDEAIRHLAACGWGGDDSADAVAEFFRESAPEVGRLFDYLERVNPVRRRVGLDEIGFECYLEGGQALDWLKEHRPDLHTELALSPTWVVEEVRPSGDESAS